MILGSKAMYTVHLFPRKQLDQELFFVRLFQGIFAKRIRDLRYASVGEPDRFSEVYG